MTIPHLETRTLRTQRQLRRWFIFTFILAALSITLSFTMDRAGILPPWLRYAGTAAAILLTLLWAGAAVRFQRSLDEMQRRMFLEVTSIIGIAAVGWAYLFPILEKAGFVRPLTHDAYALAVIPLGLIAWLFTARRYQ